MNLIATRDFLMQSMIFRFTARIWIALDCLQFSCHMRSIDCVSIAIVSSVGHVTKVKSTTLLFTLKSTHKPFGAHVLNNMFETIWQCDYTVVLYFIDMVIDIHTINFKFFSLVFYHLKILFQRMTFQHFEGIFFSKIHFLRNSKTFVFFSFFHFLKKFNKYKWIAVFLCIVPLPAYLSAVFTFCMYIINYNFRHVNAKKNLIKANVWLNKLNRNKHNESSIHEI